MKTPWSPLDCVGRAKSWQEAYPELRPSKVDPVQVAADLYLTEGLIHHAFIDKVPVSTEDVMTTQRAEELRKILLLTPDEFDEIRKRRGIKKPHDLDRIAAIALKYQQALVDATWEQFRWYSHGACGGELRYASAMKGLNSPYHDIGTRGAAWAAWRKLWEKYGLDALEAMVSIFQGMKSGSVGGPKWAACARVLRDFEAGNLGPNQHENKKVFIDRVLTLEHNGGCFLSKRNWGNFRKERTTLKIGSKVVANISASGTSMQAVLNCHAKNPPNIDGLFACANNTLRAIVIEYLTLAELEGCKIVGTWDPAAAASALGTTPKSPPQTVIHNTQGPATLPTYSGVLSAEGGLFLPKAEKPKVWATALDGSSVAMISPLKVTIGICSVNLSAGGGGHIEFAKPKEFEYTLTLEELKNKKFYFKHMLKSTHAGYEAKSVRISVSGSTTGVGLVQTIPEVQSQTLTGNAIIALFSLSPEETA